MTTSLFTVTLTDLGTYIVTVAADNPYEACRVAKTILREEATELPPGLSVNKRDIDAVATAATTLPVRTFRVDGTYSVDFSITVPAASRDEAERHAKRLYGLDPFPYEYDITDDRVRWQGAEEVVS